MRLGDYELGEVLGSGTFGQVYLARSHQRTVAVKVVSSRAGSLDKEFYVLGKMQGSKHFPNVYDYGSTESHYYMAMEPLGPSLKALLRSRNRPLSPHLWTKAWRQGLEALQTLHRAGYLHRDIKPHNILLGKSNSDLYLIDFGLAKAYCLANGLIHAKVSETNSVKGTYLFASRSVVNFLAHSRRDDLESLVLSLLYLRNNGTLPWSGLKACNDSELLGRIHREMNRVTVGELCANAPRELYLTLEYVRGLKFEEEPDYAYLQSLVKTWSHQHRPVENFSSASLGQFCDKLEQAREAETEEATTKVSWTEIKLDERLKRKLSYYEA